MPQLCCKTERICALLPDMTPDVPREKLPELLVAPDLLAAIPTNLLTPQRPPGSPLVLLQELRAREFVPPLPKEAV